jgi:hypothetical protein
MSYSHDKPHIHLDRQDFYKDAQQEETSTNQNKQNQGQQNINDQQNRLNMGQKNDRDNINKQGTEHHKGA